MLVSAGRIDLKRNQIQHRLRMSERREISRFMGTCRNSTPGNDVRKAAGSAGCGAATTASKPRCCTAARTSGRNCRTAKELFMPKTTTDRKSTRLNCSHLVISYAVFCLKKKK